MKKLSIKDILSLPGDGRDIIVEGWVRTKRESKNVCFLELSDGSTIHNIQVVAGQDQAWYAALMPKVTTGSSVRVEGALVASQGSGQNVEVTAREILIYGGAPAEEYPLQKKRHSFEFLREIAHLRPRTNSFGAVARIRSAMSFAIHKFFNERGFIYVHTPIITGNDCEGAGQMFQDTTLPVEAPPTQEGRIDYAQDFFGKRASLTVSGQLEGETYATALTKVYTFGPTFRAENSNTSRHLAEFWMIEPEMAFCDIHGNMDVAEEFIKYIFAYVLEHCPDDMEFFNSRVNSEAIGTLQSIVESRFERITYTHAVELLEKSGQSFEFPVKWGIDLQSEHERYITEKIYNRPVIITDYPKQIKAFYMRLNDDERTVAAMDVLAPGIGEIVGGSQREERLDVLDARLKAMNLDPAPYWWYRDLRRYGTVPHAGFGLGFERAVMYATGVANIRDVIPFPRAPKSADF